MIQSCHVYNPVSIISYTNQTGEHCQVTLQCGQLIVINYVSEHQLSPVIDASHTMSITHVNKGLILLKLIG